MAEALADGISSLNMDIESLTSVVQDKFLLNERVLVVLQNCHVNCFDLDDKERIVVLVEYEKTMAIFCMLSKNYPPQSFSDLSIEQVIPVNEDFKWEIDSKKKVDHVVVKLVLICRNLRLEYEVEDSLSIERFVDELCRGVDTIQSSNSTQRFNWLNKYCEKSQLCDGPHTVAMRQTMGKSALPAVRESRIKYEMVLKEAEYTTKVPYTVFATTWNVNDKSPSTSLHSWLSTEKSSPDIYAIGLQEMDLSLLFDSTTREEEWFDAIMCGINSDAKYILVEKVRLVGMMLMVLIKDVYYQHVKNVACDTVGTGIMGKLGNKGGVSIRFDLHDTSMCFVNSHLAAHTEEFERRNQDYRDICNRTIFQIEGHPPLSIKDHDQIYWIGDLNYRISDMDTNVVKQLLNQGNFEIILKCDQLMSQRKANSVFVGYQEGFITFRPTYKYDPGTDNWDSSEKNRAPAWCDRILWCGDNIEQLCYRSHPAVNISDHKPVSATFKSHVKVIIEYKYRKVYEDIIKKLDKLENELIPQVMVDRTELDFGSIKYLEPQLRSLTVANTGQVPVQFEFIRKLDEVSFCKDWLLVEPFAGCISPGDKCDVGLKIFINKNSACKLNAGTEQLYDILVLHLEGGKDIFITINGTYRRSCFGTSIEALVHIKVPISQVPVETLARLESERDRVVADKSAYDVPKEIWFLVDHIYRHGMKEANLFEQPGLHSEIVKIRDWLDEGSTEALPGSVHSAAEALLLLLESTAEPLVPYNLHDACLSASANYLQCKQMLMQLPPVRRNVFLYLCDFLQEVLTHAADNGLDAKVLSSLFGGVFLRATPAQLQSPDRNRPARQALDKKKANFVYHFLTNPHHLKPT